MPELGAPEGDSPCETTDPAASQTGAPLRGETSRSEAQLRGLSRAAYEIIRLLPKNALSRLGGRFASLHWPPPIQQAEIRFFARAVGVDLDEARDPISAFSSVQEFFTRALREGARPIAADPAAIVSPCDGRWGESGSVEAGRALQVKGKTYDVADLLGDREQAARYEGGQFATFYLSPRDYHRFHTPISGRFTRLDYHPGALWPVNSIGVRGVDRLFVRNERVCGYLESSRLPSSVAPIALVAVGATMVGSIRVRFDELRTNRGESRAGRRDFGARAPRFERGEEWGHFEFGSTLVMIVPPSGCRLSLRPAGSEIRMGESIGSVSSAEGEAGDASAERLR